MPAPTPIDIRYGSPRDIASLGLAAGSASFGLSERRRQEDRAYDEYQRRLALDNAFLMQNQRISAEDTWRSNDLLARADENERQADERASATAMQEAYRNRQLQTTERGQDLDYQAVQDRLDAQASGAISSSRGRASQPIVLGTGAETQGSASIGTSEGTYIRNPNGGASFTPRTGAAAGMPTMAIGGGMVSAGKSPLAVPPGVEQQLEVLKTLQDQMEPDKWNALWTAAQSGELKMDQLIDNARQFIVKPESTTASFSERSQQRLGEEARQMAALDWNNPKAVANWYRTFHNKDMFELPDSAAFAEAQLRRDTLGRITAPAPTQNSNGRTMTGGNMAEGGARLSPEQARLLPPGTWFVGMDGVKRQRK